MLGISWNEREAAIDDLKPFERNPRRISPEAYAKLVSSIRDNGYHQRILATHDLRVIGGHQRIKALRELNLTHIRILVPSVELSDEQFRRLLVQDNLPFGEFAYDVLLADYGKEELAQWGMPAEWLPAIREQVPEAAEEVPTIACAAVTVRGDTWLMGDHRLRCGDSTNAEDVASLLAGSSPHLMVTDPPYGVEYDADWRNHSIRADGSPSDGRAIGKVQNDNRSDWREAFALFPGDVAYVWHADLRATSVHASLEAAHFEIRAQIIWVKNNIVISRGHYHFKHEPCWYAVREGKNGHWTGDRKQSTVWEIAKPMKSETGHSTQKPVECMKRPMENNSRPGDGVYEPFSGSGTTIIAAQLTGRKCFAMEIDPLYVDMAVARWQKFTGKQAVLESSGAPFEEKKAA